MTTSSTTDLVTVDAEELRASTARILHTAGLTARDADTVAAILVDADLRGVHTHGVVRVPVYVDRIQRGVINVAPSVDITARQGAFLALDGDNGMGFCIAQTAMQKAIDLADEWGLGAVVVRRSNHFGEAAYYVEMATQRHMIGIAMSNGAAIMAPTGSHEPYLGANPFAVGLPVGGAEPVILDMATSVVAQGRIMLAAQRGEEIPLGWALDAEGRPTTDPSAALRGVLLPFGGHKGSGIALMIEGLTGLLGGGAFGPRVRSMAGYPDRPQEVSHFFLCLSLSSIGETSYEARMAEMTAELRALAPIEGVERVLVPGECESILRQERSRTGIPLDRAIVTKLAELDSAFQSERVVRRKLGKPAG